MNISDHVQIWNQAVVKVLDVRHHILEPGERLPSYTFPASVFIYITTGRARIRLDGEVHYADRFHVLHGCKGACLELEAESVVEYDLILYKASLPQNCLYEFRQLLESDNPFEQKFGFSPIEPIRLLEFTQTMNQGWNGADNLAKLQVRGLFYQFVHELLHQLRQGKTERNQHSLAEQVMRFLSEHYREPVSMEALSAVLRYSPQHLSRKFKELSGLSPIEYVIKLRMEKAQHLLLTSEATLQEIARRVGYQDWFYFNRMFKKYVGTAPGQFRNRHPSRQDKHSNPAKKALKNSIVTPFPQSYSNYDNENHYQYIAKGDFNMNKGSKTVMLSMIWLCFSIMLSACAAGNTTPPTANNNASAATTEPAAAPASSPTTDEAAAKTGTRTVSTAFGDVTIPVAPQRVMAVDYLGDVLALGVTPLGSNDMLLKSPYLDGMLTGVEAIGDSFEKVLSMGPDLIITHNTKPEAYEKYSKIAPTVSIPPKTFTSVDEELTYFGELLGKEDEAAEWLKTYEAKAAAAKVRVEQVVPKDATFSVFQEYDGQVFIFGYKSGRGGRNIYQVLGQKAPASVPDGLMQEIYAEISLEKLPEYAGDYIVLTSNRTLEELQADPIWGSLKAVREGKVYLWTEENSWYRDPIALLAQTEDLADWIVGLSK
ncbi:hypothetical protein GCM10010912_52870 [Paenibacillus albidus]|uniref:Helix-turn-helix domain-containing protein n=1 Tax=Paenibacillus albidus TaxID=2041023 RepID=A0A917CXT6_9BACL|nr:AraC family transcriptional regulator [Paenibacillus albidus]GGG01417.1 hypothetical protein GCM10010912_52870 [Paenibacillus albidus]